MSEGQLSSLCGPEMIRHGPLFMRPHRDAPLQVTLLQLRWHLVEQRHPQTHSRPVVHRERHGIVLAIGETLFALSAHPHFATQIEPYHVDGSQCQEQGQYHRPNMKQRGVQQSESHHQGNDHEEYEEPVT